MLLHRTKPSIANDRLQDLPGQLHAFPDQCTAPDELQDSRMPGHDRVANLQPTDIPWCHLALPQTGL